MHDVDFIKRNPELFDYAMQNRNYEKVAQKIIELDIKKKQLLTQLYSLQKERNQITREIEKLKKDGVKCDTQIESSKNITEKINDINNMIKEDSQLIDLLNVLPNVPDDIVPVGKDESSNVEIRKHGYKRNFDFQVKTHYELGEKLNLMDFKQAAKLSGSRFVILKNQLAQLDRALANFMLDIHTKEFGYSEISHPILVHESAMYGVGQLPKFADDSFKTTENFRLVPTSEVALTNLVSGMNINSCDLPIRLTACSPCFRLEAGSAGKDTRGMMRQHQFNKVELVSIVTEEQSASELERMVQVAEEVLKRLELPYRVMMLCTGDMGFSASITYDIEVWVPSQNRYREISSCSNCKDFQARRMNTKYTTITNNVKVSKFAHTLNGSALAIGRTIIAILENYQNMDGSITIPLALRKYMNDQEFIK
ncbi:serine--tRNA ligase [Ehrlichia canis]|uniref:Serine--tRNA ligase n=1 Tax=Ehrlichia canis (strain Jake) TaxID=269484 RepID=SYS_EHRCJ|nr:serine--tRNA ligase [Ehrlichia canis]Q3YS14.1 RecName: Full=Serine--tRNA ligase; AltName: Full=Seryl-tRNA synthetase; Short=SerRS; AltName: Full=Seryl-tRNA(Ser/Sec) synthetase [Ehrlichia canis str. Jake]AAZ68491.1 seryl-tRNA synthetase [Ehrlichia canis str. Jake]AUO54762.1 serine--tRNA ligase [Ehrlichia canis]UKC53172.1 serS [Ehrlichia canis]UKC54109.1 serS [Ehrlichia canis]UKC55045.1 serS [Ehrlichia canis]